MKITVSSGEQLDELLIMIVVKGDGAGKYWVGMCIILFTNLKNRIKGECLLRFSRDCHFNLISMSVILSLWFLLQGLFNTNHAA